MSYIIENFHVYFVEVKENGTAKSLIGSLAKTETERINDTTVADVTYQFDIEQGRYIEQSRVEREELLPDPEPTAEERFALLEAENAHLKTLIDEKDRENKNALFEIYSMLLGGG